MTEVNPNIPPSKHALWVLHNQVPCPRQEMNQTVAVKLVQFGLAVIEQRPSKCKTHKPGPMIDWVVATGKRYSPNS